jgi:hemin uptake protein HemP
MTPPPPKPAIAPTSAAPARGPRPTLRLTSEQLFAGAAEVQIEHAGSLYRLKRTSLGKLILTK